METDTELLKRHKSVLKLRDKKLKELQKMRLGYRRDCEARFIGSLTFTVLHIESQLEDRKLEYEKAKL